MKSRISKELESFRKFATEKENRKTIGMIIIAAVLLFSINWVRDAFSGEKYIIGENGNVDGLTRRDPGKYAEYGLRVKASRGDEEEEKDVDLMVNGNEEENKDKQEKEYQETLEQKINEVIESLSRSKGKKIELPRKLGDGTILSWEKRTSYDDLLILFAAPMIIWFIYLNGEKRKREEKRKKEHEIEKMLPSFNDHLLMLIGSGMIFTDAFGKIAEGYEKRGAATLFEKTIVDSREISESGSGDLLNVLTKKADSLGVKEFSKIVGMIRDNQLKGVDLKSKLEQESSLLWESRKKKAEEEGKIAETKLSLPLAMLLVVLIVITAAPAMIQVKGG